MLYRIKAENIIETNKFNTELEMMDILPKRYHDTEVSANSRLYFKPLKS